MPIAENRKARNQAAALVPHKTMRLEDLVQAKVDELKVILKAEAARLDRGHPQGNSKSCSTPRFASASCTPAIGGINVQRRDAGPDLAGRHADRLGFNVGARRRRARRSAEERGIQIRQYNIIYQADRRRRVRPLEGKLKPREDVIHLGRAVVRETFKISRVGTIAGCHVTQGTLERSAKVRVIRSGVVIYLPAGSRRPASSR